MRNLDLSNIKGESHTGLVITFRNMGTDMASLQKLRDKAKLHNYSLAAMIVIEAFTNFPVHIKMPCGQELTINSLEEIQEETVMCPCGDPTHTMIKVDIKNEPMPPEDSEGTPFKGDPHAN